MKLYTWERIKKDWSINRFFEKYNLTEEYLDGFYFKHKAEHGETPGKFLMSVFNVALESVSKQCKTEKERDEHYFLIYSTMCFFQRRFEGKRSNDLWKLAEIYKLKNHLQQVPKVEVKVNIVSSQCCPECSKNDRKLLTVFDAINHSPIGSKECTRHVGCVCAYTLKVIRDEDGGIIFKTQ